MPGAAEMKPDEPLIVRGPKTVREQSSVIEQSAVREQSSVREQKTVRENQTFLPPIVQLLLSGSGLLIASLVGVMILLVAVLGLFNGSVSSELMPLFATAWSALLICVLFVPAVIFSVRQLRGRPLPVSDGKRFWRLSIAGLVLWIPMVFLGQWLADQGILTWLLLPPLQTIAVAIPVLFLIELGRRKLPHRPGSLWSVYSFGVVLTQPVVLLAEILLLLSIGVIGVLWVSTQPALLESLMQTAQRLQDSQFDPRLLEEIIQPYLQQPVVLYIGLAVGAGFIPLLEELLKPLAIWAMLGRRFSPSEGFVYGLFAGGTFALLESLGIAASVTPDGWSDILIARVGTAILHVTSTGLVGWGLGAAWQQRKYMQLGVVFFLAFLLHGIWNFFGLLLGIQPYLATSDFFNNLNLIGPAGLGILAFMMLLILIGANTRLRKISAAALGDRNGGEESEQTEKDALEPSKAKME